MDLSLHRQQLTFAGSQLSYLDVGTGPALLFGHGYLWDSAMWAPQITELSKTYRCIVPELWGHGQSGTIPETCASLLDISEQMLSLMDSLAIEHFAIVGSGVGAIWGAELVLKAPARVNALVMIDSFIGFEPEITRAKYLTWLARIQADITAANELATEISPLFFADNAKQNVPKLVDDFEAHFATLDPAIVPTLAKLGHMIFSRRDTMEFAELLTLPSLIMVGVENKTRSVLESYLMSDAIDASQLVHIPKAGHMSTLEQADFVTEQISQFLTNSLPKH